MARVGIAGLWNDAVLQKVLAARDYAYLVRSISAAFDQRIAARVSTISDAFSTLLHKFKWESLFITNL